MTHLRRCAIAMMLLLSGVAAVSSSSRQRPERPRLVAELRTEYAANPVGIDVRVPRLSWQIRSAARGVVQTAYQLQVAARASAPSASGKGLAWDSGVVKSGDSVNVVYGGPALASGQRCFWRVRIWDGGGAPSAWSEPAFWEMGLLEASDWKASWIEPDLPEDPKRLALRRCCGANSA